MRRISCFVLCIMLICLLALPAQAATGITNMDAFSTVSSNGRCQVTLTGTLHLDSTSGDLTFPVPLDARAVRLNGSRVRTTKTDSARLINLSYLAGKFTGDVAITVSYELKDVVVQTELGPQVEIPLLSGFGYPISSFGFTITLPGQIESKPAFSSGYQQSNIEKDLDWQVEGPTVTGTSKYNLKDHETLVFSVPVPTTMFPRTVLASPSLMVGYIAMGVCGALAVLYWLFTMAGLPPRFPKQTTPPAGYCAGELSSILTLRGADLTMMVFSWAQLGYILIQTDRGKRVFLQKRMEMGNERSSFERRCFQQLFKRGDTVDTTSRQYAALCQKIQASDSNVQPLIRRRSGKPKVLRIIMAVFAMFAGFSLGVTMSNGPVLQWLLGFFFAGLGLLSGWYISTWAYSLLAPDRRDIHTSLILCGVWLLVALIAGQFNIGLIMTISLLLSGLMMAFSGHRSEEGKQALGQVLGLFRYLLTISKSELQQINQTNPEFFHNIAPYALALGLDKLLANRFGRTLMSESSYLTSGMRSLTAPEWSRIMRKTAISMQARSRNASTERLQKIVLSFFNH